MIFFFGRGFIHSFTPSIIRHQSYYRICLASTSLLLFFSLFFSSAPTFPCALLWNALWQLPKCFHFPFSIFHFPFSISIPFPRLNSTCNLAPSFLETASFHLFSPSLLFYRKTTTAEEWAEGWRRWRVTALLLTELVQGFVSSFRRGPRHPALQQHRRLLLQLLAW